MICSACKKPCTQHLVDFGIGEYEFWGATYRDTDCHWVSTCCDADTEETEDEETEV